MKATLSTCCALGGVSFSQLKASLMAVIHSLIPALFEKGASKKIIELYEYLQFKKRMNQ